MARSRFFFFAIFFFTIYASSAANSQTLLEDNLQRLQGQLNQGFVDRNDVRELPPTLPVQQNGISRNGMPYGVSPSGQAFQGQGMPPKRASAVEENYRQRLKIAQGAQEQDDFRVGAPPQRPDMAWEEDDGLSLVGYEALQSTRNGRDGLLGAVGGDYYLGVGDEVVVTLRGSKNVTYRATVDRDGRLVLPELPPVPAAGRTFFEFQSDLEAQIQNTLLETEAYVSVGSVRQKTVLVYGEVEHPGQVMVPGMASLVDALVQAGGIKKTGSLRRIQVVRDGERYTVDLYPVLLGTNGAPELSLQDNDRIVVPTLGATAAVSGTVVRPGIYELLGQEAGTKTLLALAGGTLTPSGNRLTRLSSAANGRSAFTQLPSEMTGSFQRGDILMVEPASAGATGSVTIAGHVTRPGTRPLASTSTVEAIIRDRALLGSQPYLPFVVVQSHDPVTHAPRFKAIDGTRQNQSPLLLQDQDTVIILSMSDVRYLMSIDVQQVLAAEFPLYGRSEPYEAFRERTLNEQQAASASWKPQPDARGISASPLVRGGELEPGAEITLRTCRGLRVLASQLANGAITHPQAQDGTKPFPNGLADVQVCPQIYEQFPDLLPFAIEHLMTLEGAVRTPGAFPVVEGTRLKDIIGTAGGVANNADLSAVELTKLQDTGAVLRQMVTLEAALNDFTVEPGASVRVNPRFSQLDSGPITLAGEVLRPGRYTIARGERLSDVIERAGGLTAQAYPLGAVFTRASVRREEQQNYERLERQMQAAIPSAVQQAAASDSINETAVMSALKEALSTVQNAKASGRMVVDIDPALLRVREEKDIVLQPGDHLTIPKRPAHIMVTGEVMHPGSQLFTPGRPADEYIRLAGGVSEFADEDRIFAILPNGEARPMQASFWNYSEMQLPPGSTIVIPRDMSPLSFWSITKDLTGIFGSIALSAAALATIAD